MLGIIWALAYKLSLYFIKIRNIQIPKFNLFYFLIFCSSWLGAKLFFLLSLESGVMNDAMGSSGFWLGGGFVFFGGLIFGGLFILGYARFHKMSMNQFEFCVPVIAISHSLGRLSCFLAGCCYGKHCELPWAIETMGINRHPVQLYEAITLVIVFLILLKRYKNKRPVIVSYLASYSLVRFFLEFFRGDEIRGLWWQGLSTSQWIAILILLCCAVISIRAKYIEAGKK